MGMGMRHDTHVTRHRSSSVLTELKRGPLPHARERFAAAATAATLARSCAPQYLQ